MQTVATWDWRLYSRERDYRIVQGSTNSVRLSFPATWGTTWHGLGVRAQFRGGPRNRFPAVLGVASAVIVDPGPAQRLVDITLDAEQSELLTVLRGAWDLELYNASWVRMICQGVWVLNQEVTYR